MNWFNNCGGFNNNFGYRANTATAPSNNFYTNSASNTPGSTTIGLDSGSIGLGPGGYGPGTIGTGTGTTGTGSNNGSTGSPTWGNGTGWGNRSYDNFLIDGFNPGHEQYGVLYTRWNRRFGEAAINSIDGRGGFWGNFAYPRSLYGLC